MTTLSERLKETRRKIGLTQAELGTRIGVSQNAIQKIENGETKEPRNILQLAEALGVNPHWLQFGNVNSINISGSSLNNSPVTNNTGDTAPAERISLVQDEPDDEHSHCLVHLDVNAAAGVVEYSNNDNPDIIQRIWLSDDGMLELVGKRSTNGLVIINVPTDSMAPTIPKGSTVVLDTLVNQYAGEGVYAFSREGNLFIKRLQKRVTGGYAVISDNKPSYQDEIVNDDFIDNAYFVGKFVRVWKIDAMEL